LRVGLEQSRLDTARNNMHKLAVANERMGKGVHMGASSGRYQQ
jgi:hypothetical protein